MSLKPPKAHAVPLTKIHYPECLVQVGFCYG